MSTLRIVASVTSLLMAAAPAMAASDYLLQLDPVKGEGKDVAAPQSIEVDSFSWGVSNSSTTPPSSSAGKVNMQDLSVMAAAPRESSTGVATGKRAAPAADTAVAATPVAAAPKVGDAATFTVMVRESPSKASLGKSGACASGTHYPHAVVVAQGTRYEFSDVVVTSCTVSDGLMKKEFKGHVTLMK